jgi:acid phosphatase (class A)
MNRLSAFVLILSLGTTPLFAQQLEREPAPTGEPRPQPYLAAADAVDYRTVLAPPPAVGSIEDDADRHSVEAWQKASAARRELATLDEQLVYPRFDEAFGRPIDRNSSPILVNLLNRAMRDVGATAFPAKDHYHRPRPYQRIQLQHACGKEPPPKAEANPTRGTSYPSGHSSAGWAVAMILARVAPDRAEAVMARATEYAESRIVCGRHFPSDVEAGHTIAAAVIARLDASPEFQKDVAAARAELSKRGT